MEPGSSREPSERSQRLEDRLRVLAEATRAFAELTTDDAGLVDEVARRVAEAIGDSCAVFVASDDGGSLVPRAVHATQSGVVEHARAILLAEPLLPAADGDRLLSVALSFRGRTVGLLRVARVAPESDAYDAQDVELAQLLAAHAAIAIANGGLFLERERELAARRAVESRLVRLSEERAEEAMAAEQARFRALVENSADGIVVTSSDGTFLYVSPAAARMFGRPASTLLGTSFRACVHPEDLGAASDQRRRILTGERRPPMVRRVMRPDGSVRWIEVTATNRLGDPAIGGIIGNLSDVTERTNAEEALVLAQKRFAALFESGIIGIIVSDTTGAISDANDAFLALVGYSREDLVSGRLDWVTLTPPEWTAWNAETTEELRRTGRATPREKEYVRKDGTRVPVLVGVARIEGAVAISVSIDLTVRKQAEAAARAEREANTNLEIQLRQAQKMEAVGRLAGGVAHDFNNMLSVVLSYSSFLLEEMDPEDPRAADVREILAAGERSAALTRQLLLFSRQQVIEPKVIDLNDLLANMNTMLQRILGEDITLVSRMKGGIGCVLADPSSLEQVVMNLVVNARDAMPTGGKLTIETAAIVFDEEYAREHVNVKPGPYVMLAVTDSGVGMDRATQSHIFEPFFTTKERGKGTGLGLSTVFGIVMQSGGTIWVYSEPEHGTTFKIYLPREEAQVDAPPPSMQPTTSGGAETILLVEDEDPVRAVARSILARRGYDVIEARNAGEALLICEKQAGTIHLLLTDVVMPQMGGAELARRLVKLRPEMRVLCMSGYTDDTIVRHGVLDAQFAFLQKPLAPDSLTRKVREVLDAAVAHR